MATLTDLIRICSIAPHVEVGELARWFGESAICRECNGTGYCECMCDHGCSIEHMCEDCDGDGYTLDGEYAEFVLPKAQQLSLFNPDYKGRVYMVFSVPRTKGVVVTEEFLSAAKRLAEKSIQVVA